MTKQEEVIKLLEELIRIADNNAPKQFPQLSGYVSKAELEKILKDKKHEA